MSATLLATTSREDLHALAWQGIIVWESYVQIRDMLRTAFSEEYVHLFAEPTPNNADNSIDWYVHLAGNFQLLNALPLEEQNNLRAHLKEMAQNILNYADGLIHSGDALKITRGNILKLALNYPDEKSLFVVDGQPVLICWGFAPGTPGVEAQSLSRLSTLVMSNKEHSVVATSTTMLNVQSKHTPTLWWLLPFLLSLLLLLLFFTGFGGLPALSGYTLLQLPALPFATSPVLEKLRTDNALLEKDLEKLRERVRQHAALCRVEPVAKPEQKQPVPPQKPEKKAEQDLVIPQGVASADFMAGRWRCNTGLAKMSTNEPVIFEFAFNAQGKGQGIVLEKNDTCRGEAQASIKDGLLHIALEAQKCQNSKENYSPVTISCRNNEQGLAICKGINKDGSTWGAKFNRVH